MISRQQTEQLAQDIQQQANQVEEAMAATGKAVVDQIAAHANAAAATVAHAAEVLQTMAGCGGSDLEAIDCMLPTTTVETHVIDLRSGPIALPSGAKASLPASARMTNAPPSSAKPTAIASVAPVVRRPPTWTRADLVEGANPP